MHKKHTNKYTYTHARLQIHTYTPHPPPRPSSTQELTPATQTDALMAKRRTGDDTSNSQLVPVTPFPHQKPNTHTHKCTHMPTNTHTLIHSYTNTRTTFHSHIHKQKTIFCTIVPKDTHTAPSSQCRFRCHTTHTHCPCPP